VFLFEFFEELLHLSDALPNLVASVGIGLVKASIFLENILVLLNFMPAGQKLFLKSIEFGIAHFF
jgi:hypothetical protein